MTDLLSREKEFLKLNEDLNKIATSATENPNQHQQQFAANAANGAPKHNDVRYHTYTRAKGQSNPLKKRLGDMRAAGDCSISDAITDISTGMLKPQSRSNQSTSAAPTCDYGRQARGGKIHQMIPATTATTTAASTTTSTAGSKTLQAGNVSSVDSRKDGGMLNSISTSAASHRRSIKSPRSSTRNQSRTSNRSTASTATFIVKYRNPKFVESPSLEVLIKDESTSIKQGIVPFSTRTVAPDVESVSSVDASPCSTRLSQGNKPKQITTEGLIKFLKSKIVILEEDNERLLQEMAQQKELLEKTLERHKKTEQQRDQAYSKHNAMSDQLIKVESQLDEANRRIKERMLEHASQQKELETAKRELRLLTQTNTNLEKRLYRANEELENTKNALMLMKNSERELKETVRIESEGKDKQIKSLKKQRADLLNAYKKQLYLIENLKKQNICMEQAKMIGFGEKEFTKVIDWNTKG